MFNEIIINIKKEFQGRFPDFDSLKPKLFNNPMEIEVSEVPCNMIYAGISCYKRII
jgi:hypothetical protein